MKYKLKKIFTNPRVIILIAFIIMAIVAINPHPYEIWQYSETQAAKYYARGIVINLGLDLWAGIGGERYETIAPVVKVVQSLSNLEPIRKIGWVEKGDVSR